MIISESSFSFLVMSRLIYEWFVMLQMLLEWKFEQVYIWYCYLLIRMNRTVCCRHLVYATNPCCIQIHDYIFVQLFLFVFSTKNMMRSRFITHYFLAQGKGNNVCCKRAITVIFRTVVLNCKFQSLSYFLHYL